VITGVRGTSSLARLVGGGLHDASLVANVRRVSISNVRGVSSNTSFQGVVVRKESGATGTVASFDLSDLRYSCTASAGGVLALESVDDVKLDGIDISGGTTSALNIIGCNRVAGRNMKIDASTGTIGIQVVNSASTDIVIEDSHIKCGSGDGIQFGVAGGAISVTGGRIARTRIIDIADAKRGIACEQAINVDLERNATVRRSGATTAIGIRETSSSSGLTVRNNDLSAVDTPVQNRQSASTRYKNNAGFVTEATGTFLIASGSTNTGPITHGLAFTPTAANFTFVNTLWGSGAKINFVSIGASTFQMNVNVDPGATTCAGSWTCKMDI
jgi:hypothetical protein